MSLLLFTLNIFFVRMCASLCVFIIVCVCVFVYMCVCLSFCVCVCLYVCVFMALCDGVVLNSKYIIFKTHKESVQKHNRLPLLCPAFSTQYTASLFVDSLCVVKRQCVFFCSKSMYTTCSSFAYCRASSIKMNF